MVNFGGLIMDVFSFINSKDVSTYLKEINYEFNTLEAAWIAHHSKNKALPEKISAWEEIINTMPDFKLENNYNTEFETLFEYLKKYIEKTNKLIEEFNKDGLYEIEYRYGNTKMNADFNYLYTSIDSALAHCKKQYEKEHSIKSFCIKKRIVNNKSKDEDIVWTRNEMLFRANDLAIIDVSHDSHENDEYSFLNSGIFEYTHLEFPVPFKKGDIVCDCYKNPDVPFVLEAVGFDDIDHNGDDLDSANWGSFAWRACSLRYDWYWYSLDLEYYKKDLEDEHKVILPISMFLKGKIGLDLCCDAYHRLASKIETDSFVTCFYDEEDLEELF